jgi:hypothetical protein
MAFEFECISWLFVLTECAYTLMQDAFIFHTKGRKDNRQKDKGPLRSMTKDKRQGTKGQTTKYMIDPDFRLREGD